jgi:GNAT superfamily N-acetyltransferase
VQLRRGALRGLARARGLTYFTKPGMFGAMDRAEGAGGGLWALGPDVGRPLRRALDTGAPDWVALTEPAAALVPVVTDHGYVVVQSVLAMAMRSLSELPEIPLPPTVSLQPVDVHGGPDSISLEEALLVDVLHGGTDAASARRDLPLEAEALRELPGITLLAAVDEGGSCVATAGTRVVGRSALVSAVATIPQYRRRGIAAALTAAALRAARETGAVRAFLDASAGESVYARLGFTPIGTVTRCHRAPLDI